MDSPGESRGARSRSPSSVSVPAAAQLVPASFRNSLPSISILQPRGFSRSDFLKTDSAVPLLKTFAGFPLCSEHSQPLCLSPSTRPSSEPAQMGSSANAAWGVFPQKHTLLHCACAAPQPSVPAPCARCAPSSLRSPVSSEAFEHPDPASDRSPCFLPAPDHSVHFRFCFGPPNPTLQHAVGSQ